MTTPALPEERGSGDREKGFFAALFDVDFESFVALRFIKVIYVIAIVFIGLAAVAFLFVALARNDLLSAIFVLVFLFFYLIMIRVTLEVIAILFQIGEDTRVIRTSLADRG